MNRNLTGQKFGRLTVTGISKHTDSRSRRYWKCKCSCSNTKTIREDALLGGITKSCNCLQRDFVVGNTHSRIDLVGKRFRRLVVLECVGVGKYKTATWKCQCDCGNIKDISGGDLRSGKTGSCGCLGKLPKGESAFNSTYSQYRRNAAKRNLEFLLSKDQFRELTSSYCYYCGRFPSNSRISNNGDFTYNGIDRMDNTKGYTIDNCVPCCKTCNKAKNNNTKEEFINWILRVYNKVVMKSEFYKFQKGSGSI